MRRAIASILLAIISFPLMGAAMTAQSSPACCRRDGKHHCEMSEADKTGGPGLASAKCASWGNPATALRDTQTVVPKRETARYAPVAAGHVHFQVTRATVRSSRSVPKRGPPSLLP